MLQPSSSSSSLPAQESSLTSLTVILSRSLKGTRKPGLGCPKEAIERSEVPPYSATIRLWKYQAVATDLVRREPVVQFGLRGLADHHQRRLGKQEIVWKAKYAKHEYEEIKHTHHSNTDQREKDNLFLVKLETCQFLYSFIYFAFFRFSLAFDILGS